MASETVTWEIPYPDSTDNLCDGYLYIQQMAERVDEILDEFDTDLEDSLVVPLARASRIGEAIQVDVDSGELIFTAIDFDTTGITNVFTPTAPIEVDEEHLWMMGGYIQYDYSAATGTTVVRVNSVNFISGNYRYSQRVTGTTTDIYGTVGSLLTVDTTVDRIFAASSPGIDVNDAYVWAWRVGILP